MKPKILQNTLLIVLLSITVFSQAQETKSKRQKSNKKLITLAVISGNAVLDTELKQIDLTADIINNGNTTITERGFVYSSTIEIPTTLDNKIVVESDDYIFNSKLENVIPNTIYYVRSYAINASGIAYGNVSSIETSSLADIKIDLKARIKTYPNPSTNFISLSGLAESKNYTIYSMQGKEMARGTISNDNKIDVRFLANGLYILKLENLEMVKFIKE
ncbi:T9SS type A sorting domain-containing protein [Mariniflexile jejuense]|uniref:T9SS type A sorting domain-containing protein n=1 Tax=Mariniflexile jejuense TaxID=1173582 RepID=A0ABW3JFA6_9FLAO